MIQTMIITKGVNMKTSHMIIYCNISKVVAILPKDISKLGFQLSFVGFK